MVNAFISKYISSNDKDKSYWFANTLFRRFIKDGAEMMYDRGSGRFAVRVRTRVYDIRGDVTTINNWIPWLSIDGKSREKIISNLLTY